MANTWNDHLPRLPSGHAQSDPGDQGNDPKKRHPHDWNGNIIS